MLTSDKNKILDVDETFVTNASIKNDNDKIINEASNIKEYENSNDKQTIIVPDEANNNEQASITQDEANNNEQADIHPDEANKTNCLALTLQEDHKIIAIKNVFLRTLRMSWKVIVSSISLWILKLLT